MSVYFDDTYNYNTKKMGRILLTKRYRQTPIVLIRNAHIQHGRSLIVSWTIKNWRFS
jgi:hypothetical protein